MKYANVYTLFLMLVCHISCGQRQNVWSIIEDKKGNIWTTGEVNFNVWALSRYDAKSITDFKGKQDHK
jgi:hypothetical protein